MKNLKVKDKFEHIFLEAESLFKNNEWEKALLKYKLLLKIRPHSRHLLFQIALVCNQLEDYVGAYKYLNQLISKNPNDADALTNLAVICTRLSLLDDAVRFFELALLNKPNNLICLINLAGIYNLKEEYGNALNCCKEALKIDPLDANLYLILGITLVKLNQLATAKIIFETALTFDPTIEEAKFNIAIIDYKNKKFSKSIEVLEDLLTKTNSINEINSISIESIKFCLALNYLSVGRLSDGWKYYDSGLHASISPEFRRNPIRSFAVPMWDGKTLNKTILIWAEQGLGDEIMFASCIPDLINSKIKIIIECDKRLVPIFKRSFPQALECRETSYDNNPGKKSIYTDFDFHLPFGSLMKFYRNSLDDFNDSPVYLKVNDNLKEKLNCRAEFNQSSKLKIGISWRSGKLNPERNDHYTSLVDWKSIFEINELQFFNLQYGDCDLEIIEVEKLYNIKIIRYDDINLQNNIELTLALISNLDLVITINTAARSLAASIGIPVLLMGLQDYENFGTNYYPFHPKIKFFTPLSGRSVSECICDVKRSIEEFKIFKIKNESSKFI